MLNSSDTKCIQVQQSDRTPVRQKIVNVLSISSWTTSYYILPLGIQKLDDATSVVYRLISWMSIESSGTSDHLLD